MHYFLLNYTENQTKPKNFENPSTNEEDMGFKSFIKLRKPSILRRITFLSRFRDP